MDFASFKCYNALGLIATVQKKKTMKSFKDRKKKFEEKFAHDMELQFKVESRASKLFGLWVAGQIGIDGDEAAAYAREVVTANLEEPGMDDVIRKVKADLNEKGVDISDHILTRKLDEYMETAKEQICEENEKSTEA